MKTTTTVSLRTNRQNRASRKSGILASSAAALLSASLFLGTAHGANQFFDNNGVAVGFGGAAGNWDLSTLNWNTDPTGGAAGTVGAWTNTATSDAVFNVANTSVNHLAVALTVRNITFNANGVSIDGNFTPITFAPGATITVTNAGDTATMSEATSGSSGLIIAGPGTFTFNGIATNGYTGTTTVNGGTFNLNKAVADQTIKGNLQLNGGTTNLAQSNQIVNTATVTLAGGTFAIGANSDTVGGVSLQGGSITGTTGVLTSTSAFDVQSGSASAILAGTAGLVKTTAGTVTLSGANTYTGGTTVTAGTLRAGSTSAFGAATNLMTVNGGTLDLNGNSMTIGGLAGSGGVVQAGGGPATLTIAPTAFSNYSGTIQDGGSALSIVVNTSTFFQAFSGNNTYTGTTTVNAGAGLNVGTATALGSTAGGTVVNAGGTLSLVGVSVGAEALTINGVGIGSLGALRGGSGTSGWAGAITVASSASITVFGSGNTLNLTGGINKTGTTLTLGSSNLATGGGTINISSVGISGNSGAFNSDLIVDSATVNLDVANTYLGPTFIRSTLGAGTGVLNAGVANALPTANGRTSITMDDSGAGASILNIGGTASNPAGANQSIASLAGAATSKVVLGSNTLTIGFGSGLNTNGTANAKFAGVISGNGGIFKDDTSTQILTGVNTYTGLTTVNGGTLQIGDGATAGSSIATSVPAVIVNAAGTLAINLTNNSTFTNNVTDNGIVNSLVTAVGGNQTLSGVINGTGKLLADKGGVTVLANVNGYQGGTRATASSQLQIGTFGGAPATAGQNIAANTIGLDNGGQLTLVNVSGNVLANNITNGVGGFGVVQSISALTTTLTGTITDGAAGSLVLGQNGTGTTILANAGNTYTGTTSVGNGTLQVGTAALVGSLGSNTIFVTNSATLAIVNIGVAANNTLANNITNSVAGVTVGTVLVNSANTNTLSGTLTDGPAGSGTLALTQAGSGTTILTNSGNIYSGTTTISKGTLQVGTAALAGSLGKQTPATAMNLGTGGTLSIVKTTGNRLNNGIQNNLGGTGLVSNLSTAGVSFSGNIRDGVGTLAFTQAGTGASLLVGNNTYSGGTNVTGGTLFAGSNTALGAATGTTTVAAGATLDLNGNTITQALVSIQGTGDAAGLGFVIPQIAALSNNSSTVATLNGQVNLAASASIGGPPASSGGALGGIILNNTVSGGAAATLTKVGTDTLRLNGANTYTGGTTLNAGRLLAGNTKAFGSGNLTINGGTAGTVGGPLIVNIGGGNFNINGGTVVAQVGGTTPGVTHDQFRTTGNAGFTSTAGTLALVQLNNYLLAPGDKVNLVVATGGVVGGSANGRTVPAAHVTGLSAFSNSALLIPVVNLYTTSVTLEALQGSFAALSSQLGLTPNQLAVAGALDSLTGLTGGKTGVFKELNYLDTQSLTTLKSNLDKIAPEELTSIFNVSVALANVNNTNLQRHMEDIRTASQAVNAAFSANVIAGKGSVDGAHGPVGRRSHEVAPASNEQWGMFLTGSGEFTHIGSTTNASGFNLQTGGVTAGIDYRVSGNLAIGLNLGYANTTASLVNGGSLGVDGGNVGLYATWFEQNFHVDAAVSGGINSYKTRRVTPNNTVASGSPNGAEVNVIFGAGYDWKFGGLTVGPTASFQYTNTSLDGFTETGAFAPLTIAGKSSESIRTNVGVRAYYDGKIGSVGFRPEVRAGWQHEAGATGNSLTSNFATLGGRAFTVAGTTVGRDSVVVGAGFTILWNDRFATYVNYDGNIGAKNLESHSISGGARLQF